MGSPTEYDSLIPIYSCKRTAILIPSMAPIGAGGVWVPGRLY